MQNRETQCILNKKHPPAKVGGIDVFMVCKDCSKRKVGCHSVCKDYITEKEQRDRQSKIIRQAKLKEGELRVIERMKGRE